MSRLAFRWDNEGFAFFGGICSKPGPGGCRTLFQFHLPKPLLTFDPQILYTLNYLKSKKIITIQLSILYVVFSNQLDRRRLKFASASRQMAEGVRGLSRGMAYSVLWQPQGMQPLGGQCQCPLFWTGIYEGHLGAPPLSLLLVLFLSLLEEIAEASLAHSPHLMGHT